MPWQWGHPMSKTLRSARHDALIAFIVERRKRAGLTQADVAKRLQQYQSYVARVESGQRRIDVIEFIDLSEAIGFDPADIIRRIVAAKR
jgi:transcriptional regulator with XRE-family HTH domain